MGAPSAQVAQSTQPQGKGGFQPPQPNQQAAPVDMTAPAGGQNGQPQGKGGNVTYPGQGGQPQMGRPNTYSNTVGPWDNASIKPQIQSGKGKGY